MGDYTLTGLNPRDFEHLIQALALKTIATGVMPFGDGPDGGREATFNGKMIYPSAIDPWDGYLVIQAKFLSRPSGDSKKNGEWALNQLKSDLLKFEDAARNLRKPDYYLFVTNVVLTPVQDVGSKDKAFELLSEYKDKLGFKSYDIWDYDKICRLLDGQPEIYTRYGAFITTGDVLSKIISVLDGQQSDFQQVMSLFLQAELRTDQFVRLEQAGHTPDQKTALAQVFVDLPSFDHPTTQPPEVERNAESLLPGIVSEVLNVGSQILRRSVYMSSDVSDEDQDRFTPERGRYVLVGGPGQGKSTVAQFLSQIYRAAILKDSPSHSIIPEAHSVLELIQQQCHTYGISMPSARRFPVRIVLDQFASDLADGTISSLLLHILRQIAITSGYECSAGDLRRWLKAYPWLLILDGLDEVPATSNRSQVLEKISDFLSQVAVLDADVLVLATTRPQGYNDEFSPRFYHHRFLAPLSKARALHYGDRLTAARYTAEPARRAKVSKRLSLAVNQEATGRLMRTPLQVTIMTTLLDQIGQPPKERYRLFQQYYDVIYRREIERDIPASRILQQRKADVNAIHNRVGLLLQTESELAGNSEAQLTEERFVQLVRSRMSEEGYEGAALEALVDEIRQSALQRLVFLVGLETNRIGFEIRSLQEYTAAEALMDGGDIQVRERLVEIAPSSHWRNVFLFAAGKCFAERQFLRDMIVGICGQLNDSQNDNLAGVTLAGSRLALDLLDDGVAKEQPIFARALTRQAITLMELPDASVNTRLAAIYDEDLENLFKEHIQQRLGQTDFGQTIGAWIVLLSLVAKQINWATELANAKWPINQNQQISILTFRGLETSEWVREKLSKIAPMLSPRKINYSFMIKSNLSTDNTVNDFLTLASEMRFNRNRIKARLFPDIHQNSDSPITIKRVINPTLAALGEIPFENPAWMPSVSAVNFAKKPGPLSLARELRRLAENCDIKECKFSSRDLPWPLAACIASSVTTSDLIRYAERARSGELGKLDDWLAAEGRWSAHGITEGDVVHMTDERWPFDSTIRYKGFPFSCSSTLFGIGLNERIVFDYSMNLYESLPLSQVKDYLANILFDFLLMSNYSEEGGFTTLSPKQAKYVFSGKSNRVLNPRVINSMGVPDNLNDDWIDFFEWLGNTCRNIYMGDAPIKQAPQLAQEFVSNPERKGLFLILGALSVSGSYIRIPNSLLDSVRSETDLLRRAALLIETSLGGLNKTQADRIAREAHEIPIELNTISYLLRTIANQNIPYSDKENLVMALHEQSANKDSYRHQITIRTMNELMQSRQTSMCDSVSWQRLSLPPLP